MNVAVSPGCAVPVPPISVGGASRSSSSSLHDLEVVGEAPDVRRDDAQAAAGHDRVLGGDAELVELHPQLAAVGAHGVLVAAAGEGDGEGREERRQGRRAGAWGGAFSYGSGPP